MTEKPAAITDRICNDRLGDQPCGHRYPPRPGTNEMCCAICGRVKAWPAAFPNMIDAICWQCFWQRHNDEKHMPKRRWRWRSPLYRETRRAVS